MNENITTTGYQENMVKFRKEADELCTKYNNLDLNTTKKDDVDKILKDLDTAVEHYNNNAWSQMLSEVKATDDPMKAAVTMFSYQVIKVKDVNIGDKEAPVIHKELSDTSKIIDLKKVHTHVANGIGHNEKWYQMIEKFNLLMTVRVTTDIKSKDAADAKAITKTICETFDIPRESAEIVLTPDLISNNKMIAATQMVVDAMLGEGYKVTSHDTKFIEWRYGKKSRNRLCVTCSTAKELMETMLHVCNKLVTDGTYEAEYKKAQ